MAPKHSVAVILAAGLGTRMKSRTPKVLHPICGRPMLAYVIDAARAATGNKPIVVYSPQTDAIKDMDGIMRDAVKLKFLDKPLTKEEIAEFIQIPPRKK